MEKILVYLEPQGQVLKRVSYEAITAANALAGDCLPVIGIAINATGQQLQTAGDYGLKEAVVIEGSELTDYASSAYAKAVAQVAKAERADYVIFPANAAGLELAPRVAILLEAGYVADCIGLSSEGADILAKKPVYAGKAVITTRIETDNKVFSLRPNVFTAVKSGNCEVAIKKFDAELTPGDFSAKVVSVAKNEGKLDVLEADMIVSGGRGIKGPENYHLIESLAASLRAAVGASRAVVDAGWRPHNEQVGQTGKTVSPTMYIACGISGAIQHLAGMSTSKTIVAINKDKDAPIFKVADYGIVGDLFDVLPKLTEQIHKFTGK